MGSEESDEEQRRGGRGLAGTAGAAAAAGGAITGAQALLGMDVAEAAVDEDGAIDSVVPLGDAPVAGDDGDLDEDVDAFLAEDATVALSDPVAEPPGEDPLDDDLVGDAFTAGEDPADALGGQDDLGGTGLAGLDESDAGDESDAVEDVLGL